MTPKPKFKVGDIVAWDDWERYYKYGAEIVLVVGIEYYSCTIQYRILTWNHLKKKWERRMPDFFTNGSVMEEKMVPLNKLYLLMRYEIS